MNGPITPLLLAGEPHPGSTNLPVYDPWSGAQLHRVAQAGPAELEVAADAAVRAFEVTRRMPAWKRAEVLRGTVDTLTRRRDELAELIRSEGGKPIQFARLEVSRALDTMRLCAEEATRIGGEILPLDGVPAGAGRVALIRRVPRGPVLAIAPFNFPLNLVCHKVGPAVAAGCSLVVKPAEQTPGAALVLGEALVEAGWPAEAISVLPCDRSIAARLVPDPRFATLTFTGSDVVGWRMKAEAGHKHVLLELGGNASVIVEPDADLARAAPRITVNAYAHAGQVCISVQHVLVHRSRLDELRERLVAEARALPTGDTALPSTVCGPLIDTRAQARVLDWMAEAEAAGARRLVGGEVEGGVIRPTLYEDVPPGLRLSRDEVFGPVALLRPYDTFSEAVRFVNSGRFGLQVGVFTRDVRTIWRAAEELDCGGVIHDDVPSFRVDAMPYGGQRDSGVGREGPRFTIEDLTERRTLVLRTTD